LCIPKIPKENHRLRTINSLESQLDNRYFVVELSILGETNKFKVQQNYLEATVYE